MTRVFISFDAASEKATTYLEYVQRVLLGRNVIKTDLDARCYVDDLEADLWKAFAEVAQGEKGDASGLTAYQRACLLLHAALKALRKSGGCLKDLSGCNAPTGWQQRLLTSVRVAAFFHGRKVDARNLP